MARVNDGSRSFTCQPHVYPQTEWTVPAFTPQPQNVTALWPSTEGRRLSWCQWSVINRGGIPARRRSSIRVLNGPA